MSLQKRKLQKYLQGLVLRRYKLLAGKKTIAMADTKGVLASYHFDAVEIKTGKKVKLRVDTFYFNESVIKFSLPTIVSPIGREKSSRAFCVCRNISVCKSGLLFKYQISWQFAK